MKSTRLSDTRAFAADRESVIAFAATGTGAESVSMRLIDDKALKAPWINDL